MFAAARRLANWGCLRLHWRQVNDDAEALLSGYYLEYLRRGRRPAPAWAAINAAAHGDLALIREVARRCDRGDRFVSDPAPAASVMAAQVVAFVGDDDDLLDLVQKMLLVPLEARLMDDDADLLRLDEVMRITHSLLAQARPGQEG